MEKRGENEEEEKELVLGEHEKIKWNWREPRKRNVWKTDEVKIKACGKGD